MRTRTACLVLLLCGSCAVPYASSLHKPLLGHRVYWAEDAQRFDTVGWRQCAGAILDTTIAAPTIAADSALDTAAFGSRRCHAPQTTLGLLASRSRRIHETGEVSAVALALLTTLGYPVVVLSQWNATPSAYIKVHGSAQLDDTYNTQRLATDFLYERVERCELQPTSRLESAPTVTVWFAEAGKCQWPAPSDICRQTSTMVMPEGDYVVDFAEGGSLPVGFVRRIYRAYVVTPADCKAASLTSAVEREMDRLKLDISYKAPVFREVKPLPAGR